MALRLSTPAAAPRPQTPRAIDFAGRGQAALIARDHEAYAALHAEATALEDVHRRYKARLTLVEAGFVAAATMRRVDLAALYLTLARHLVETLEEEPREPVLLNYLGVATYELGSLDAADALFRAARRLDPALQHTERNIAAVTELRRSGGPAAKLPAPVAAVLPELARRAAACAGRARPAEGLTLSLCMIVKDEEEMLPRCLEAVRPAVDEMIVVDTGSTDRTVEIAQSFGARVIHHEWNGSFSDARNVSIDAATGDWLLYLDADEVLVAADAAKLRELTGRVWREAFFLVETNFTGDLEDGTAVTHNAMRVWRNRPEYRFEGRLHEQFAHKLPGYLPERLESTTVRVEHYGYLGVVRDAKAKSARNVELLERQAAEGVDTPFQAFNLGSEYGAMGDATRAAEQFEKAWSMLADDPQRTSYPYVPSLVSRFVKALRLTGRLDAAERQAEVGLELLPGFTDLVFEQACSARDRGQHARAAELFSRCLELGDAPARYSATVGCGTYLALVALAELRVALGERDVAEALLLRCLDEHPSFFGAVLPVASLLLSRGQTPTEVVAAVERRVGDATPTMRFMLGTALYEAGHAEAAERQFRALLERQPGSGQARAALGEALLSQGRFEDAAREAALLEPGAACAAAARRTELFALLVLGDSEGADAALERARGDLDNADLALFEAWLAAARGGELPASLPPASTQLLLTVLEALLRLKQVHPFGLIVGLLERTGLGARDRRELLATIYLRRGYLDSAAEEWITACDEGGPDAPALVGLAQVAAAKQLPDDALTFARGASEIDPGHAGARRLVERLAAAA